MRIFFCLILLISSISVEAQFSPLPSSNASVSQIVGITKINIEYSRPGVKSRKIFGGLIPFNSIWRTGANAATKIEFSNDVSINGSLLKAGKYSIVSIPTQFNWIIIFSSDLNVTEQTYNKDFDVLRISVPNLENQFTENLTFEFTDVKEDQAFLNLFWDKTLVKIPISVNNENSLISAIEIKNLETAAAFQQVAEYMLNKDMDLIKAKEYIDKSIILKETFRNHWIKGRLLEKEGNLAEALKFLMKADKLGQSDQVYSFFKPGIEQHIQLLKEKTGLK